MRHISLYISQNDRFQADSKIRYRYSLLLIVFLLTVILPARADACQPMVPFLIHFVFPSLMSRSVLGLAVGVVVKCVLFALLVRQASRIQAACWMFFANIVTSVFGFVLILAHSMYLIILLFPLVCILATLPSRSLRKRMGEKLPDVLSPGFVGTFLFLAVPISGLLYLAALRVQAGTGNYWILKLAFIYAGLAIGIGMTTLWEEWLVFSFSNSKSETNFLPSVLRTNVYTFLTLAAIGAVTALPLRLAHPSFLLF